MTNGDVFNIRKSATLHCSLGRGGGNNLPTLPYPTIILYYNNSKQTKNSQLLFHSLNENENCGTLFFIYILGTVWTENVVAALRLRTFYVCTPVVLYARFSMFFQGFFSFNTHLVVRSVARSGTLSSASSAAPGSILIIYNTAGPSSPSGPSDASGRIPTAYKFWRYNRNKVGKYLCRVVSCHFPFKGRVRSKFTSIFYKCTYP